MLPIWCPWRHGEFVAVAAATRTCAVGFSVNPGIGRVVNGSQRWIPLPVLRFSLLSLQSSPGVAMGLHVIEYGEELR